MALHYFFPNLALDVKEAFSTSEGWGAFEPEDFSLISCDVIPRVITQSTGLAYFVTVNICRMIERMTVAAEKQSKGRTSWECTLPTGTVYRCRVKNEETMLVMHEHARKWKLNHDSAPRLISHFCPMHSSAPAPAPACRALRLGAGLCREESHPPCRPFVTGGVSPWEVPGALTVT